MRSVRVLCVGAGIGGLSLAVALRRAGIDVAVFEQAPELQEVGAGIGLWANAIHALRELGLGSDVLALGGGALGGGIRDLNGRWLTRQPAAVLEARWGAPTIGVLRSDLQALLLRAVPNGVVRVAARATGFIQTADAVTVAFENGGEATGDVLVGADGLHSVVRAQLAGARPPRYRGYTAWRGIASGVGGVTEASEFWGNGERFGVLPGRDGLTLWYASANAPEGASGKESTYDEMHRRFDAWPTPISAVIAGTPEGTIVRNDVYDRPPTRRWVDGRVALLGDAAHPMTPDLGQGACQAIVDATTLATSLAHSSEVASALSDYVRQRWRTAGLTTLAARALGAVGQWEHPLACRARSIALRAMPLSVQLRQLDAIINHNRGREPHR